jgi:tetratricopeptide (TPR) repeat protein
MRSHRVTAATIVLSFVASVVLLFAMAVAFAADAPSLFEGLGNHSRKVVTANPAAQKYFDQGLAFLFAFNHDESIRSFKHAAALDPDCAMAHWGVAIASGPHYNKPDLPPDRAQQAWDSLQKARAKAKACPPADQALIEAQAARYADPSAESDRKQRDEAYAKAMRAVWETFPDDGDVGALYAESMMDLRPWALWTADGKPQPGTEVVVATLETVLTKHPDHPLALHLYIHAVEASPNPGQAERAADRLRRLQPALGHMVHMPSHIDIRRGRWQEAVEANERAIKADGDYARTVPGQEFYRMYMAHNHHMLAFAAMMQGQSAKALAAVRAMIAGVPPAWLADPKHAAIVDGYVTAPMEVMKRFGRWDDILAQPEPPEIFPIARAMRHELRGVAFAAKGHSAEAREEQKLFREAVTKVPEKATFGNNTSADLFAVAVDVLEGEILAREGKLDEALAALRSAAAKEDKLRYSEPPDWVVPVKHALGAWLLKAGKPAEAEAVYRADLVQWPDNGWSLLGLTASLEAQGKSAEADAARKAFEAAWKRADVTPPASCFCAGE